MNSYINYLLEANFGLVLFLLLYVLLLNSETNFAFKRTYLLGSLLVAVLFPVFTVATAQSAIPSLGQIVPPNWLPEFVVVGYGAKPVDASPSINVWQVVSWLYLAGVALFAMRFLWQAFQLARHLQKANVHSQTGKYKITELDGPFPTFSFFNHIFIGNAEALSAEDRAIIVRHERVHADHFHSIDILFLEVLRIAFWFNPVLYFYKKIFINVHEFQADAQAVEHHDVNQYCNLLAKVALMSADFRLANHFNNSLTLKRIIMMKTIKKKMRVWKVAAVVVIVAGFFFAVACQDQVLTDATEVAKTSTMALDVPKEVQAKFDALQKEKPNAKFVIIEVDEQGKAKLESMKSVYDDLMAHGDQSIASMNVIKPTAGPSEPVRNFVIVEYKDEMRQISEASKSGEVFTIVEQAAEPVGGIETVMRVLSTNISYPSDVRMKGIEGTVFVGFIVNKDGSLSDFEIKRGIDPQLDKEALRVAQLLPNWTPGKQSGQAVRQQFVLPIAFRLNAGKPEAPRVTAVEKDLKVTFQTVRREGKTLVEGSVLDESGNPMKGSNVIISGSTRGTTTDDHGKFVIDVGNANGQLAVSFVGYKTEFVSF
ncbi:TonB family protein [Chryseolinea lacunae]|uniref:TonB family protein n=1 Tax=Chryseolinea lacunae TaxID=2801331 RepID=A0ABS1KWF0_9BACT|nr:TonB family protein [Chryseolinea lacunae]MBL0743785.1 TonB family protein [Chryseolinea lacunae]